MQVSVFVGVSDGEEPAAGTALGVEVLAAPATGIRSLPGRILSSDVPTGAHARSRRWRRARVVSCYTAGGTALPRPEDASTCRWNVTERVRAMRGCATHMPSAMADATLSARAHARALAQRLLRARPCTRMDETGTSSGSGPPWRSPRSSSFRATLELTT